MTDTERALQEALDEGDILMERGEFLTVLRTALGTVRSVPVRADPVSQLTESEVGLLRRGGLASTADLGAYDRARAKAGAERAVLLARALSTKEAALRLEVDASRIRQLLAERRLLGVRDGTEWRILDVQFIDRGLVPNIGQVVSALPADLPPLVAAKWLTSPEPDLEIENQAVSPIDWLSAGGDPGRVSALARDL